MLETHYLISYFGAFWGFKGNLVSGESLNKKGFCIVHFSVCWPVLGLTMQRTCVQRILSTLGKFLLNLKYLAISVSERI